MKFETKRELNSSLGTLVECILRDPARFQEIDEMATLCGYSRFHLMRVFRTLTGESLYAFTKRVRMERAAYFLRQNQRVSDVATSAGYDSAESFCRAFSQEFKCSPRDFRQSRGQWQLSSPENLHWNPQWDRQSAPASLATKYPTTLTRIEPIRCATMSFLGNYSQLGDLWESVPILSGKEWITIYHDNMWTSPNRNLMRSELGFKLKGGSLPKGFLEFTIPGGLLLQTTVYIARSDRNEAWSFLSGRWPNHEWGWDEYESHPLPFDNVKTRICILIGS